MEYTIEWMENKDWEGKKLINATLKGEGDVTIWELDKEGKKFPGFDDLKPGGTVVGNIWTKPGTTKKTLYAPKAPRGGGGGAFKQKQIEDTMIKKEQSIGRFQDSKEHSIKVSSTFRAAVDSALEEFRASASLSVQRPDITALFKKWREYYWNEFDVKETDYPPFK